MTRRATTGSVNLAGLLRASQRDQERKSVHPNDGAPHGGHDISSPTPGPLARITARIMGALAIDSRPEERVWSEPSLPELQDVPSATGL
jgi:hypothetical protein